MVIDFFDGNIDRPFVMGRIHEAQRSPTRFDLKGQLPDTRRLSGIRSQEIGGQDLTNYDLTIRRDKSARNYKVVMQQHN